MSNHRHDVIRITHITVLWEHTIATSACRFLCRSYVSNRINPALTPRHPHALSPTYQCLLIPLHYMGALCLFQFHQGRKTFRFLLLLSVLRFHNFTYVSSRHGYFHLLLFIFISVLIKVSIISLCQWYCRLVFYRQHITFNCRTHFNSPHFKFSQLHCGTSHQSFPVLLCV